MNKFFQRIADHEKALSAFLVVIISLITYAPLLSQLGFYREDWHLLWSVEARGLKSIFSLFTTDRPFWGPINYLDYVMLGDKAILWQWYALIWRVLLGLGVLWLMRLLWPRRRQMTTLVSLLVVVFPGFLSQPVAELYKNFIFGFALAMYSLVTMILALQAKTTMKKALLWGASTISQAVLKVCLPPGSKHVMRHKSVYSCFESFSSSSRLSNSFLAVRYSS